MPRIGPLQGRSFVDELIADVDEIRQISTDFGLRPYRVFLVWVGWSADEDGDGTVSATATKISDDPPLALAEVDLVDGDLGVGRPTILREFEILPTPKVAEVSAIRKDQDATGLTERGELRVTRISAGFSEDLLMGLLEEFRDPDHPDSIRAGVEFFWEIRENRDCGFAVDPLFEARQTRPVPRRRFHVAGTPARNPGRFEWVVELNRADGERARDGSLAR